LLKIKKKFDSNDSMEFFDKNKKSWHFLWF
jgi:hypothetical protein